MKFERAFIVCFNIMARLFGVLCVGVGAVFLISAYTIKENRTLDAIAGVCILAIGVAFLLAKSVRVEQIARMRRFMGREE